MKKPIESYVAAVIIEGKTVLVCRELCADGFPKSGFHFPGGKTHEGSVHPAVLKALIQKKYKADIRIISTMTPISGYARDGAEVHLYPFLCQLISPLHFPTYRFQYRHLELNDLNSVYLDHFDKILAQKVAFYYPLYTVNKAPVRSPHDKSEINVYIDSLLYFSKRLPATEVSDFSALARTAITVPDLRRAYAWLLDLYGLDYNEYLDVLDFRKAHQG